LPLTAKIVEQYAEYLGLKLFGPKPGLEMKIVDAQGGGITVGFGR